MRANTLDAKALEIDGQGASGGSNPNLFINGQFDIWQRSNSVSGPLSSTYSCADRWVFYDGANGTADVSRQEFTAGQTDVPGGPVYYAEYDMTVQATSGGPGINQRIEDVRIVQNEQLTFSFYAKLASGTLVLSPFVGQNFGSTGSSQVVTYSSQTITVTSTWTRHIVTFDVPSISGKTISGGDDFLAVGFDIPLSSGTFTLSLCNMKAERGGVATPYERRPVTQELALCQRYYEKSYHVEVAPGSSTYYGASMIRQPISSIAATEFPDTFKVEKRVVPTVTWYSPVTGTSARIRNYSDSSDITVTGTFAAYPPARTRPGAAYHAATGTANDLKVGHWVAEAEL